MASHKLYITGNGFDLHHGIKSSYYDFKNYLKKANPELLTELDLFIDCENIWGDFENSLAFLSREKIMEAVDIGLPNKDPDDEDFSVAEYEIALEQATGRVWQFTDNLKYWFHKWIKKMDVSNIKKHRCLQLDKDAFFINFNYIDLLETCYQISSEQIIYLHGNKNDKVKLIILGHSLSEIDREYFKYLQTHHKHPEAIEWEISFNSESDLQRIDDFIWEMNIERERVTLFKLNDKKNI